MPTLFLETLRWQFNWFIPNHVFETITILANFNLLEIIDNACFAISSFLKALTFVAWSLLFWQSAFSYVFLSYFLKIQTDSQQHKVFFEKRMFSRLFSCLKYFKRTFVETFFICVILVDLKRNQVLTIWNISSAASHPSSFQNRTRLFLCQQKKLSFQNNFVHQGPG